MFDFNPRESGLLLILLLIKITNYQMNLQKRIELLLQLNDYLQQNGPDWQLAKEKAERQNGWFTQPFINIAVNQLCQSFLTAKTLKDWADHYHLDDNIGGKNIGIVMAGNIPLVGFHDFLSVFISGHSASIKLSSKDDVLLKHFVDKMTEWEPSLQQHIQFADMLKGCDAYIATGTNNSARYFEKYFGKYPHIIRSNRTSIAILDGSESVSDLEKLSDDVHLFFGLGCRNVTKIYVPKDYDFIPLLRAFDGYNYFKDHNKFRNNYDYQLSLALLNNVYYMANDCTLLMEQENFFSPISQLHYEFFDPGVTQLEQLAQHPDIQCIIGKKQLPFGSAQMPGIFDYADGIDTMQFLLGL